MGVNRVQWFVLGEVNDRDLVGFYLGLEYLYFGSRNPNRQQ